MWKNKIYILFATVLLVTFPAHSQSKKENIKYKYKKFEKFDFEDIVVEGETGAPGDLSIIPRYQRKFKNRLPYRKNFNAEIKKAIERIR